MPGFDNKQAIRKWEQNVGYVSVHVLKLSNSIHVAVLTGEICTSGGRCRVVCNIVRIIIAYDCGDLRSAPRTRTQ
jgi:hypothetical protein